MWDFVHVVLVPYIKFYHLYLCFKWQNKSLQDTCSETIRIEKKKDFMINRDPLHSFKITLSDWHQQYIILTSENIAHGRRLWLAFCPRWIHREFWTQYGQSHQTPETPHWAPECNSQTRTWSICQPPPWFCYTSEQSVNHSNTSVCNKSQTNIFFNLLILSYDKKLQTIFDLIILNIFTW